MLAVKDHALEDGVDEGCEGLGCQTVGLSEVVDLLCLLLGLELVVAGADRGLVEAFTLLECTDVFGDLVPLVEKLGVGLDQADELLAADRELLRVLILF
jgi:hypothetical protein